MPYIFNDLHCAYLSKSTQKLKHVLKHKDCFPNIHIMYEDEYVPLLARAYYDKDIDAFEALIDANADPGKLLSSIICGSEREGVRFLNKICETPDLNFNDVFTLILEDYGNFKEILKTITKRCTNFLLTLQQDNIWIRSRYYRDEYAHAKKIFTEHHAKCIQLISTTKLYPPLVNIVFSYCV